MEGTSANALDGVPTPSNHPAATPIVEASEQWLEIVALTAQQYRRFLLLQADPWQTFISKLDAFDEFITHVKLAPLQLMKGDALECSPTGPGNRKTLILVDDMPQVNGVEMHRRLANSVGERAVAGISFLLLKSRV